MPPRLRNMPPRLGNAPPRLGNTALPLGNTALPLGNTALPLGNAALRLGNALPLIGNLALPRGKTAPPPLGGGLSSVLNLLPEGRLMARWSSGALGSSGLHWVSSQPQAPLGRYPGYGAAGGRHSPSATPAMALQEVGTPRAPPRLGRCRRWHLPERHPGYGVAGGPPSPSTTPAMTLREVGPPRALPRLGRCGRSALPVRHPRYGGAAACSEPDFGPSTDSVGALERGISLLQGYRVGIGIPSYRTEGTGCDWLPVNARPLFWLNVAGLTAR
jgi:hypothetical protein